MGYKGNAGEGLIVIQSNICGGKVGDDFGTAASYHDRGTGRHTPEQIENTCKQHEEEMSNCNGNIRKFNLHC